MQIPFFFHRRLIKNLTCEIRKHYSIDPSIIEKSTENVSYKSAKRKTNKRGVSEDVVHYVRTNNPCIDVDSIPKKYLTKTKSAKSLYFANPYIVEQIAKVLKPHIELCKAKVIECNPGLGLLTSSLMQMKVNNLILHEPDIFFHDNLVSSYPSGKFTIYNTDIIQVPRFNSVTQKLDVAFDYMTKTSWDDECNYQMIATLKNQDFLRYILRNFTNQDGLLSYGRPVMFLFITPVTYQKLIAGPHQPWNLYKPLAVLFQILFQIDLLMKVERHAFLPWPNNAQNEPQFSSKDDPMYLIRIEGKRDIYKKLGQHNEHRLRTLQKFVTHAIGRKKQRVIPTIEQWVPGFGPHLIARHINVYTLFNELTPDEILDIFCMIHHIPGYEDFDIPEDEVDEKQKEERIDTSIDMFMEEGEHEDEGMPGAR